MYVLTFGSQRDIRANDGLWTVMDIIINIMDKIFFNVYTVHFLLFLNQPTKPCNFIIFKSTNEAVHFYYFKINQWNRAFFIIFK